MTDMHAPKQLRIPFDSLTLRAVAQELHNALAGGQIQDIRQPEPAEILLGIRSHGRNYLLLLSADARFARCHLTAAKKPNPPTPPGFCALLRKRIEDATLRTVRQLDFDRVMEFEIAARADDGTPTTYTLVAELMGKHSNLVLVDEFGVVVDSIKRITHRVNRVRETLPNRPYIWPPGDERASPFGADALALLDDIANGMPPEPDALADALMEAFAGLSPFLAREVALRTFQADAEPSADTLSGAWDVLLGAASREQYAPIQATSVTGEVLGAYPFSTVQLPAVRQKPTESLGLALDAAFRRNIEAASLEAARGELRGRLDRELKRLERQRQSYERALSEAEKAEEHRQLGELLLANLWKVEAGAAVVTVQDYFAPDFPERDIPLDPKLSPQENAEACFRRYRKARDGAENALEMGAQQEQRREDITAAKTELVRLSTEAQVRELRAELLDSGLISLKEDDEESSGPDFQGHRVRRISTTEGFDIYVGETATANDFLTHRVAAPGDIWLHVRAAPSAHVVIRTGGQPQAVPRKVIERAALLCALSSGQKHSSLVAVDYTLKKYVRKPRGAAPGAANYVRETTLHVTPKP